MEIQSWQWWHYCQFCAFVKNPYLLKQSWHLHKILSKPFEKHLLTIIVTKVVHFFLSFFEKYTHMKLKSDIMHVVTIHVCMIYFYTRKSLHKGKIRSLQSLHQEFLVKNILDKMKILEWNGDTLEPVVEKKTTIIIETKFMLLLAVN